MKLLKVLFPILVLVTVGIYSLSYKSQDDESPNLSAKATMSLLTDTRTTQYFTDDLVPIEDMTLILNAGRCAASGRNKQNWYFGAILNPVIINEIAGNIPKRKAPPGKEMHANSTQTKGPAKAQFADAPAIIALAANANNLTLGLACQNMVIAAADLGYGTKIVMSGTAQLNEARNRSLLNIPDDMDVIAVLYVGVEDTSIDYNADGVTGASTRLPLDKVSTIVE